MFIVSIIQNKGFFFLFKVANNVVDKTLLSLGLSTINCNLSIYEIKAKYNPNHARLLLKNNFIMN